MDLDGGRILIDGHDSAGCTQASLRRSISYVSQDPQMLHRSIAENIWYGRDGEPDMDRIRQVSEGPLSTSSSRTCPRATRRPSASAASSSPGASASGSRSPRRCSRTRRS